LSFKRRSSEFSQSEELLHHYTAESWVGLGDEREWFNESVLKTDEVLDLP